ncbi:MAG: hypothetical protein KDC87_03430, partial [Planctomycetes bacterium]|nr:hypothetical protein [Planctomycetota bacterium]
MIRVPVKSSVALWLLAPLMLSLSVVRPPNPRSDRASRLPTELGGFHLKKRMAITANMERLLGTRDVAWWVFADAAGHESYVTMVFHDSNWKSLHPPHICIRGSNFNIDQDGAMQVGLDDGRKIEV